MQCHMGMLGGGHYVAYIKGSNNKWYLFNDSACREVEDEEVVKESRHAYMLFYRAQGLGRLSLAEAGMSSLADATALSRRSQILAYFGSEQD